MIDVKDLHWTAGFLEGEGCFLRCGSTISATASQVEKDPIDKLFLLFKGHVGVYPRKKKEGVYYIWRVYGPKAASIMMTLYPLLSSKRKRKIKELLDTWVKQPIHNRNKTHCKYGHLLSGNNLYVYPTGRRMCKICQERNNQSYWERKKQQEV